GGAFPSLPTRRISSSGTVIHESGPDKGTLGVLRPALPLNHLPTAPQGETRPPADLAGHPSAGFPATAASLPGFPADSRAGSARDGKKPAVVMSNTSIDLQGFYGERRDSNPRPPACQAG